MLNKSKEEIKSIILSELDNLFDNKATSNYMNHITQDWNNEPFIKGGYLTDHADWKMVRELGKSVNDKVYFAEGAYTDGEDWVSVHVAASSAKAAVDAIVS